MQVIKRDKTEELFQIQKIERAIEKAFESCGKPANYTVIDCIRRIYNIFGEAFSQSGTAEIHTPPARQGTQDMTSMRIRIKETAFFIRTS